MSKHGIMAGLALFLMFFANISWAACACDMPQLSSAGHNHNAIHHADDPSAGIQAERSSKEPCPHDCPEAKAVTALPTMGADLVLTSSGFNLPLATAPVAFELTYFPRKSHADEANWQTGPPYLKRTPVQLSTLMLN